MVSMPPSPTLPRNQFHDTLTSLTLSKFFDSDTTSQPPSPTTPSVNAPNVPNQVFMQIPDRIDDLVHFAWVDLNDRFGPGPNTPTSSTALTPEKYPVSIFVRIPQPHMLDGKHRWGSLDRLRLLTWTKLGHIIMGNQPAIPCNSTDSVFTCSIC